MIIIVRVACRLENLESAKEQSLCVCLRPSSWAIRAMVMLKQCKADASMGAQPEWLCQVGEYDGIGEETMVMMTLTRW